MCCSNLRCYQVLQIVFAIVGGITYWGLMNTATPTSAWVIWKKNETEHGRLEFGLWSRMACDDNGCTGAGTLKDLKWVDDMDLNWRIAPAVLFYISSAFLFIAWIWSMATFCCRCCRFYVAVPLFTALSFGIWIGGVTSFGIQAMNQLIDPCNNETDPAKPCYGQFGWSFILACIIPAFLFILLVMAVFIQIGARKADQENQIKY